MTIPRKSVEQYQYIVIILPSQSGLYNLATWSFVKYILHVRVSISLSIHLSFQSVEGIILLPQGKDFPKLVVDGSDPHFLTVGAKGEQILCTPSLTEYSVSVHWVCLQSAHSVAHSVNTRQALGGIDGVYFWFYRNVVQSFGRNVVQSFGNFPIYSPRKIVGLIQFETIKITIIEKLYCWFMPKLQGIQ